MSSCQVKNDKNVFYPGKPGRKGLRRRIKFDLRLDGNSQKEMWKHKGPSREKTWAREASTGENAITSLFSVGYPPSSALFASRAFCEE